MFILNSSGWSLTKPVTLQNKSSLLQYLILDEVITKRERQLKAIRKGLNRFQLLEPLQRYKAVMMPLFVRENQVLVISPDGFESMVSSSRSSDKDKAAT